MQKLLRTIQNYNQQPATIPRCKLYTHRARNRVLKSLSPITAIAAYAACKAPTKRSVMQCGACAPDRSHHRDTALRITGAATEYARRCVHRMHADAKCYDRKSARARAPRWESSVKGASHRARNNSTAHSAMQYSESAKRATHVSCV